MKSETNPSLLIQRVHLPQSVTNINAGAFYSIGHTKKGIWVWGSSPKPTDVKQSSKQIENHEPLKFISIPAVSSSSGSKHTFAWSETEVFCWGSNQVYELGLEEEKKYDVTSSSLFAEAIEAGINIKQISCGQSHSLAVLTIKDGEEKVDQLFGWGDSKNYQLALDSTAIIPYPVQIQIPNVIIRSIYSRNDFNILLTQDGTCYSWGSNIFGRIGCLGIRHYKIPTQIKDLKPIREIGIGLYHCIGITRGGEGYAWGHGMQGQLGINEIVSQSEPRMIKFQETGIKNVSCGEYHSIILGEDGHIYSCGSNSYGALGHSETDQKKRCKKLTKINYKFPGQITRIVSGNRHNLVLTQKGEVFSWGSNTYGQLGPKQFEIKSQQDVSVMNNNREKEDIKFERREEQNKWKRLHAWKIRYDAFINNKDREQKLLLKELDEIMRQP